MVRQMGPSCDSSLGFGFHGRDIEAAVDFVKANFVVGAETQKVVDLAFIGNSSGIYPWAPSLMVDLDVCLFVDQMDYCVGSWLAELKDRITVTLSEKSIEFWLRIVNGFYKPPVTKLEHPIILAHLAVFTEQRYLREPLMFRWCWRKYRCLLEEQRLLRLAPQRPGLSEVLNGKSGINEWLTTLESERVVMKEWLLPDLSEVDLVIDLEDPNFAECCFASAATCARHHCRALGHVEADKLPNVTFFKWYQDNVLFSADLEELMAVKERCRNLGFGVSNSAVRRLAISYLRSLRNHLLENEVSQK